MYTVEHHDRIMTLMHPVKSAGTSIHTGIIEASTNYKDYKVHVNQRHAHIRNLPEAYKKYPKYVVIREPHKWYRSFYRFFLGVEGYLSFMLNDPKEPYDGYIYPIKPEEFVRRSFNFRDTLVRFENKSRVFRNLLRSQGHMHFITGYFESDFHPDEPKTMEQFNMTLFDWFMKPMGEDCIFIPMNRLDIIEEKFKIKIPEINKTPDNKPDVKFSDEFLEEIRLAHDDWYQMLDDFDENNLMTIKEWKEK